MINKNGFCPPQKLNQSVGAVKETNPAKPIINNDSRVQAWAAAVNNNQERRQITVQLQPNVIIKKDAVFLDHNALKQHEKNAHARTELSPAAHERPSTEHQVRLTQRYSGMSHFSNGVLAQRRQMQTRLQNRTGNDIEGNIATPPFLNVINQQFPVAVNQSAYDMGDPKMIPLAERYRVVQTSQGQRKGSISTQKQVIQKKVALVPQCNTLSLKDLLTTGEIKISSIDLQRSKIGFGAQSQPRMINTNSQSTKQKLPFNQTVNSFGMQSGRDAQQIQAVERQSLPLHQTAINFGCTSPTIINEEYDLNKAVNISSNAESTVALGDVNVVNGMVEMNYKQRAISTGTGTRQNWIQPQGKFIQGYHLQRQQNTNNNIYGSSNSNNMTIVNHIQTIVRNKYPSSIVGTENETEANFYQTNGNNQNLQQFQVGRPTQNRPHSTSLAKQTILRQEENSPSKTENSFNRKLKENRAAFMANQQKALSTPGRSLSNVQTSTAYKNEFGTSNCSDVSVYNFGRLIGQGAYAIVKECIHKPSGEVVAIKQYDRTKLVDYQRKKQAEREIRILSKLSHPNIVKLFEAIDSPQYVYLVMEFVHGESLHSNLKATQNRRFTEDKAKSVMKQLLSILAYLHQRSVTHRDIKLENIIIDKRGVIKLIDFGFCCCNAPEQRLKVFCGTPSYMCPEIVMKREYLGPPTDIWASGVLLFAMLCGTFPFRGMSDKELYKKISKGQFSYPEHVSQEAQEFLNKMLQVNPSARRTATGLLQDPWLSHSKNFIKQTSENFLSTKESSGINTDKPTSK